jgi:hypothetical protein
MATVDNRCHLSSFTQIGATDQKVWKFESFLAFGAAVTKSPGQLGL